MDSRIKRKQMRLNMMYYRGFGVEFDTNAQDYRLFLGTAVELKERFSSLSYVYNYIDTVLMDLDQPELLLQVAQ